MGGYNQIEREDVSFNNPGRHCEFGRALVQKRIAGHWGKMHYLGLVQKSQKDAITALEEQVYVAWDAGPKSPPKQRARNAASVPKLTALLFQNGRPKFPDALVSKFPQSAPQHQEVLKLKAELDALWPPEPRGPQSRTTESTPESVRAVGRPDLTGVDYLDVSREVDLAKIPESEFQEEKQLSCHVQF